MADIYEDERLAKLQEQKTGELQEVKDTLGGMAQAAADNYNQQKQEVQNYKDTQTKLQQELSDLTISQIEQNKDQAEKDYKKEQGAAYADYQKQTAQHGIQAEQMADMGMSGTGYAETNRMAAYNAYQARVAAARESFKKLEADYKNAIAQAQFQNNSALAQIAYDALVKGLEINSQSLQYSQSLALQELSMTQNLESTYYNREQSLLSEIKNERVQAASVMAQTGDFSGYKDALGLTDEQVANLQAAAVKQPEYEPLTGEELDYWEARFKSAKSEDDLFAVNEMMINNGINPDVADALLSMYLNQKQSGLFGQIGQVGNTVKGWFNNWLGGIKTTADQDGELKINK